MTPRFVVALALLGLFCVQTAAPAQAARKYYPPGFTPPPDELQKPDSEVPNTPGTGDKPVIIKTVPVTRMVQSRPKDALQVLVDAHRYFDALRLVDSRLKKSPGNVSLLLTRGGILRDQGDYEQAISQFQGILDKNRDKPNAKSIRASALNGLGWTYYQKALRHRRNGEQTFAANALVAAQEAFRQATQLAAWMSYPWAGLGRVALLRGNLAEASRTIGKAHQLAPGELSVNLARAELLMAQQKPDEALQILYGLKKSSTNNPEVYLFLAQASLEKGRTDDAIINLKQLLEIMPDHPQALKLLSQSYERKMKPEDASQVLERALALNSADEESVQALLKIYDQRGEEERGTLLLKSLLKAKPDQAAYGIWLMERLARKGHWDEAYGEGLTYMGAILANRAESEEELQVASRLFAQAVYQHGKGLLEQQPALLVNPVVQQVYAYSHTHLQKELAAGRPGLSDRLSLLLLNPLLALPPLPSGWQPAPADGPLVLPISYLSGDLAWHEHVLERVGAQLQPEAQLKTAWQLFELGDYGGAKALSDRALKAQPQWAEALALRQKIGEARKSIDEQLNSLHMLPRRISDKYWDKAASDVLRLGSGDWQTHAKVAEALEKRRQSQLALVHQKLAAHYAPTERQREYWNRKAEKTAKKLAR